VCELRGERKTYGVAGVMVWLMKLEQSAVCWACTAAAYRVPVTARAQLFALQARLSKTPLFPRKPLRRPPRAPEARDNCKS
jgi:hypothetical protein